MDSSSTECAGELLDVVPMVMRSIRTEMSRHRITGLSVVQFRTMRFLQHHPETSLIDLTEHLGLTPPSVSKMIDGLVARVLVVRQNSSHDRRRIALRLSPQGEESLDLARRATLESLIAKISSFTLSDCEALCRSLNLLKDAFSDEVIIPEEK